MLPGNITAKIIFPIRFNQVLSLIDVAEVINMQFMKSVITLFVIKTKFNMQIKFFI